MLAILYVLQQLKGKVCFREEEDEKRRDVCGWAMEREFTKHTVNYTEFHLPSHYEDPVYIGRGTYGNVCRALDSKTGQLMAVKKFAEPFRDGDVAKKTYREIRLLRILNHENVIELADLFTPDPAPDSKFQNVYVVTTHAGHDLKKVMDTNPGQLSDAHCRFIVYQLFRGLKYLHSANIVHRDLKPRNVCISPQCDVTVTNFADQRFKVKILDFGMARKMTIQDVMTEYVVTRFYRAPEIVYWNGRYDSKADVWSVGCILGELLQNGRPLFPGENSPHQFILITKLCGSPDDTLLRKIEMHSSIEARNYIEEKMPRSARQSFREYFPHAHQQAIDLLEKILVLDPDDRISVEQCLADPYLAEHHREEDEPCMDGEVDLDDEFPGRNNIKGWKKKIWDEIMDFNSPEMSNNGTAPGSVHNSTSVSSADSASISNTTSTDDV